MGLRDFLKKGFDNTRRDVSSMAQGLFPALDMVSQAAVDDIDAVFTGNRGRPTGRFMLDDIGRTASQEFVRQTPVVPLLTGHPIEAAKRLYARPVSGSLDLLGLGSAANAGLKVTSHVPGGIGLKSQSLRGYKRIDPSSLGEGLTIGDMPSKFNLADGTQALSREYLLRPDIENTVNGTFARQTMRSPKPSGNALYDNAMDIGETLADDHLALQSVPRARYEPFAKIGDITGFGPKIGSARFGRRLEMRNRSKMKVDSNVMMANFGVTKNGYRKEFSDIDNIDDVVGNAIFLKSGGINRSDEIAPVLSRLEDGASGKKAILTKDGVDLMGRDGQEVSLNLPEYERAQEYVKLRNEMASALAKHADDLGAEGKTIVLTGGEKDIPLDPDFVRKNPELIFKNAPGGNLRIREVDHVLEPKSPGEQGRLFGEGDEAPSYTDYEPEFPQEREIRRDIAERYSQAAWHKNYLDNLVKSRVDPKSSDVVGKFKNLAANDDVKRVLDSDYFNNTVWPSHQALVAAELEADRVRLGSNALSDVNIVRNNERIAMLTGKEGQGTFFVSRKPRTQPKEHVELTEGTQKLEVEDANMPGDPTELIAKGALDTNPKVHLSNYLRRRREAGSQDLVDSVADASVLADRNQAKTYLNEGVAMLEDDIRKPGMAKRDFVIVRPHGKLFKQIEELQPLSNHAARRLAEEGYHEQASNVVGAAKEMFESSKDGGFSLGDMIRDPKLRGEMKDSHYMVPTEMYEAILNETSNATNALSSFLQAASTGFKISVLHGRWPAWVVNNTIGSQVYLAMTGGLGATIPHAGAGRMVKEFFPDVIGSGSREMASGAEDMGRVANTRMEKVLDSKAGRVGSDAVNALSDWNQKIADEPARIMRIEQIIEDRFKSTQELAKARGVEIPDTLESRQRMFQDPSVREDIAREALDDMIDFSSLSRNERMWVSNIIPFWTFIKGSTKSTIRTGLDHPGRYVLPAHLGDFGSERTDEQFPAGTPQYLRSMINSGDDKILSVGAWNPYGQQASMLGGALSIANDERPTGQDHPASMVNPAIISALEAGFGRDIYTDYPMTGNAIQNIGGSIYEAMPLPQTMISLAHPGEDSGRSVFKKSRTNTLLNFMGLPVRDIDRSNLSTRLSADEKRRSKDGLKDYWEFHDGI